MDRHIPRSVSALLIALGGVVVFCADCTYGHGRAGASDSDDARAIEFPDTAQYKTMVVDLHTHSVFSDGHVWPNVRVAEAERDGLNAVAVTEHLEYQPHRPHLPHPDRNASYREALGAAVGTDLIVINGAEITRDAPAGHMNAVFVDDANSLVSFPAQDALDDPGAFRRAALVWPAEEAVLAANDQGAFVFWNHAWWSSAWPNRRTRMTEFHEGLASRGKLHGIEVVNGDTYNEEAHRIALDHDLVLIGTSDVHNLIDWDYAPHEGGHRPVTLVLAEQRNRGALKDALFGGRTVVWFKNLLIGRPAHLQALLQASLTIDEARQHPSAQIMMVTLRNHSDAQFRLRHTSTDGQSLASSTDMVDVAPHATVEIGLKADRMPEQVSLEFEVSNALIAPNTHPLIKLEREVSP